MRRRTIVLALLLSGCTDLRHPTASEPSMPALSAAVISVGCGAGRLVQAINSANAAPGSTINLAAGCTYLLPNADNIYDASPFEFGANGLPVIRKSVTINGNGATIARSPIAPEFRIFYIYGAATVAVTLNDLTLTAGHVANSGGALVNHGATLTLNRVTIRGNTAGDFGGGLVNRRGTLHVNSSKITGDSSSDGGGGLFNDSGTVHITATTISWNHGGDLGGGVLNLGGTIVIRGSVLSKNRSEDSGGGIVNVGGALTIGGGTIVTGNHAEDDGGGVANYGANTLNSAGIPDITKTTISIDSSTISGNVSGDDGGGLSNMAGTVRIHTSRVSGNLANDTGGGLRNENLGALAIQNSTLSNNQAVEDGGGLYNVDGTATVIRSTISGNVGRWGGGVGNESGGSGGVLGIYSSTISGNRAGEGGGGLFNDGGHFTLANSTVSGNTSALKGGGGVLSYNDIDAGGAAVGGSIIAGNTPEDVAAVGDKTIFKSLGHNLIGTAGAYVNLSLDFRAAGDRRNVADPKLGPLADNGGPTLTRAVLSGSPALNAGGAVCPTTDQRGERRPWGGACDIGSVEGNAFVAFTRLPTDGWDEKNGTTLLETGTLDLVKTSDGVSYEVSAGYFVSLEFENIPRDSTVMRVLLHVTHDAEAGFAEGAALWQVGGGTRSSPFVAMEIRPEGFGNARTWDLTPWVRTANRVNNLTLTFRNLDPSGKKILVDQAYLEIVYGRTPPKSTTAFPVTLFVLDGWNSKDSTTLALNGAVPVVNGSDDVRAEVDSGSFAAYRFTRIPGWSVIQSVKVHVEHHEEEGFAAGGAVWRLGGGLLSSPTTLLRRFPIVLAGELNEDTEVWGASSTINTAALVNDLKFVVRNKDVSGKTTKIDRVYVVVTHKEP